MEWIGNTLSKEPFKEAMQHRTFAYALMIKYFLQETLNLIEGLPLSVFTGSVRLSIISPRWFYLTFRYRVLFEVPTELLLALLSGFVKLHLLG